MSEVSLREETHHLTRRTSSYVSLKVAVMGGRGAIGDKWSMRVLWLCAIGSALSLYMVAVERQIQNRDRMLAESLSAAEAEGVGEDV